MSPPPSSTFRTPRVRKPTIPPNPISNHAPLFLSDHTLYGSARLGQRQQNKIVNQNYVPPGTHNLVGIAYVQRGWKAYELSNHLGNVLSVISDRKEAGHCNDTLVAFYYPDIIQNNDYYPFGSPMEGRGQQSKAYRFGFNGKEKDDEIKGSSNSIDFGARIYDPQIAQWLSVDPLARKFPEWSPFAAFKNNPIVFVDPDGKAPVSSTGCCGGLVDELIDYAKRKASQAAYNLTVAAGKTLIQLTTAYIEHKLDEAVNSNNAFRSSVALTTEFVTGLGPQEREFGANHPFTQSLAKSNMTTEALKAFQTGYDDTKAGKRKDLPSSYRVDFSYGPGGDTGPFREFFKDGEFTAAQFLGTAICTFRVDEKK